MDAPIQADARPGSRAKPLCTGKEAGMETVTPATEIVRRLRGIVGETAPLPLHEPEFAGREKAYVLDCIESEPGGLSPSSTAPRLCTYASGSAAFRRVTKSSAPR